MTDFALEQPRRHALSTWLFHPFNIVAGGLALGAGVAIMLATGLLNWPSHSHLDGVLDFHSGLPAPLWFHLIEGPLNWLVFAFLLYLAGRVLSRSRIRAIDVFGTQALARAPYLLMALAALIPGSDYIVERLTLYPLSMLADERPWAMAAFVLTMLVVIVSAIWSIVLMYQAYAVSCNIKGVKAVVSFIVALLVAEVLTKIVWFKLAAWSGVLASLR